MNLHRLLSSALGSEMPQDSAELHGHMDLLMQADAENKRRNQKLYLILDIDETLVFSKRMKPGAEMRIEAPVGKQIMVHNQPFDMVLRPGLETFLQMMQKKFVIFLYTMGDDAYTHAVLDVIDPKRQLIRGAQRALPPLPPFLLRGRCLDVPVVRISMPRLTSAPTSRRAGGVCCWRPSESREYKDLRRVACDPSMAVVVDDSIDVWRDWLPNLCLTRRFVGDPMDDGLMLLCSQLTDLHTAFYAARGAASAPTVPAVLSELRGKLLEGCVVAFTGLVADQSEELLKVQPLCVLVRQYGAVVTLDVEDATHLVARKKEGWKSASKIRRALQRQEARGRRRPLPPLAPAPGPRPFWPRCHSAARASRTRDAARALAADGHVHPRGVGPLAPRQHLPPQAASRGQLCGAHGRGGARRLLRAGPARSHGAGVRAARARGGASTHLPRPERR